MLDLSRWFQLNAREFERQFALPAVQLKEVIALDDMELLPEQSSIRVSSHDLHGPLPQITFKVDPADWLGAFDLLGREAVKLCAISRLRRELDEAFSGAALLPPTTLDSKCVAGLQWRGRTLLKRMSSCRHTTGCGRRRSGGSCDNSLPLLQDEGLLVAWGRYAACSL